MESKTEDEEMNMKTECCENKDDQLETPIPQSVILTLESKENESRGIFANTKIPQYTKMGPYKELNGIQLLVGHGWKVIEGKLLNTSKTKSWMHYVNYVDNIKQQNLTTFQDEGFLYFKALRDIDVNEELVIRYEEVKVEELNGEKLCVPIMEPVGKDHHDRLCSVTCENVATTGTEEYVNTTNILGVNNVDIKPINYLSDTEKEDGLKEIEHITVDGYTNSDENDCPEYIKDELFDEISQNESKYHINTEVDLDLLKEDSDKEGSPNKKKKKSTKNKNSDQTKYSCTACDFFTHSKMLFFKHRKKEHNFIPGRKKHNCPVCDKTFSNKKVLRRHVCLPTGYGCKLKCLVENTEKDHPGKEMNTCVICSYRCYNQGELEKHLETHLETHSGSCKKLENATSKKLETINSELYTETDSEIISSEPIEKLYNCVKCNYSSDSRKNFLAHMKRHSLFESGVKRFVCEICNESYVNKGNLIIHMVKHTGQKPFECSFCEYRTDIDHSLMTHYKQKHKGQEQFFCDKCPAKKFDEKSLLNHKQVHLREEKKNAPEEKLYICSKCDYSTAIRQNFLIHVKRHGRFQHNIRPYVCKICGVSYVQNSNLNMHMAKHMDEKPFGCRFCKYRTETKSSLMVHYNKKHKGQEDFVCDICPAKRFNEEELLNHKKTHGIQVAKTKVPEKERKKEKFNPPGAKNYKCSSCDYETDNKEILRQHLKRVHKILITPYMCEVCGSCFSNRSYLRKHMNIHTADKLFECSYCDFQSIWKTLLYRHMRGKHADKADIECDSCDFKGFCKEEMKVHLSKMHAE